MPDRPPRSPIPLPLPLSPAQRALLAVARHLASGRVWLAMQAAGDHLATVPDMDQGELAELRRQAREPYREPGRPPTRPRRGSSDDPSPAA